jgi:hypothetical protein
VFGMIGGIEEIKVGQIAKKVRLENICSQTGEHISKLV